MKLTHVTNSGEARMVDISDKSITRRSAVASGRIFLQPSTIELIKRNQLKKGDVLSVARIAAICAAKKTSEIIPLCHNIPINWIDIHFSLNENNIEITAKAISDGKTGIEMEVLTATSIAALTIYDMCKAADKKMVISDIKLKEKKKNEIHG